jgi:hypothetical protein
VPTGPLMTQLCAAAGMVSSASASATALGRVWRILRIAGWGLG